MDLTFKSPKYPSGGGGCKRRDVMASVPAITFSFLLVSEVPNSGNTQPQVFAQL